MQLKTILAIALAALCCQGAMAQKKGKKAKHATPAAQTAPAQTLKPVDGKTFSYAFGVAQGRSLKEYLVRQLGVDTAYLDVAMEAMTAQISEDARKRAKAYAAGLSIAETNDRMLPQVSKQATGKADSAYIDRAEYERALKLAVLQQNTMLTTDSANKIVEQQAKYQQETYKAANEAWLANNAKLKGVKTTASGLQYRVLTQGTGPVANDTCEVEVHYEGSLIDGTVFDSSYKRNKPSSFKPNQVIKGWNEALKMMPEGSVWELYIPASLGYGERGQGQNIPGNSTLIFKVEVIKVKPAAAKPAAKPAARPVAKK